jgi:hypothetical protein
MASVSHKIELASPEWREARWQKRVVILLWASFALALVLGGILLYAKYQGLFAGPGQSPPFPPGPPSPW